MKCLVFERSGHRRIGIVQGDWIVDLEILFQHLVKGRLLAALKKSSAFQREVRTLLRDDVPSEMTELLAKGRVWLSHLERVTNLVGNSLDAKDARGMYQNLASARLQAPILRPGKIVCVGRNYAEHARESGSQPSVNPIYFLKSSSAICRPGGAIRLPANSNQVDYEAELAVVLGRRGKQIPADRTHEYIAGYTILNDVSARDMQELDGQWFRAKSCDTFSPIGPWIVTSNEIPDPGHLRITLTLNGNVMQDSDTSNLIFSIPFLISYLSTSMTWEVGDILSTGTPSGVGVHRTPPVFLRPGDIVKIAVEKVGELTNTIAAS
jgi:acylpyruvate hydrolase